MTKKWDIEKTSKHSSRLIWKDDGVFGNVTRIEQIDDSVTKTYSCPRGHTFKTNNPIVIAVDGDNEYNSGPICGYCYVNWFKVNLNASEESVE
tara:strand:- start:293 stop:571 length:279 start_codon:yes stop_codon:yes gene_type:complete